MMRGTLSKVTRATLATLSTTAYTSISKTQVRHFDSVPYLQRHVGPQPEEQEKMLAELGFKSLDEMSENIVPKNIVRPPMPEKEALTEHEALQSFYSMMNRNKMLKSMIGQGYYDAAVPAAILRNVLETPGWYTPYTPYQAEISQGRIQSLLNFQTMVTEMTAMPIANASLLDEATAAFEAVYLAVSSGAREKRNKVFVSRTCFTTVREMIRTRAEVFDLEVIVDDIANAPITDPKLACVVVQTPDCFGEVHDFTEMFSKCKENKVLSCCGTDLLACSLAKPPGEMGASVVYGSAQRFGIPMGYGGPSAAFFAVRDEHKRLMPGRLIGVSKDAQGKRAVRMALQTREQHIKREKATSNICTAQALLANMSGMYAIYHGQEGILEIADRVHSLASILACGLQAAGHNVLTEKCFDTIAVQVAKMSASDYVKRCADGGINVFLANEDTVCISVDETTSPSHIETLLSAAGVDNANVDNLRKIASSKIPKELRRTSNFLTQPVFKEHRSETKLMRFLYELQRRDYGLSVGMVPLGSCTMKLNSAASMLPMSWPSIARMHPYVPEDQAAGYAALFTDLGQWLKDATGFAAVSLQPNSGAQGEYTGLRTIRAYHQSRGESHRNICLIPANAHGTNPASAKLCNMDIVVVRCDAGGHIDKTHLHEMVEKHSKNLAAIMITYPSTYGFFDSNVVEVTDLVHQHGGQVYIDGANLNSMVGLSGPPFLGGDVCHINLHKTFSIPHGGGGPGMGPICVREHLAPFLPNSAVGPKVGGSKSFGQVSQAPFGSASVLSISYMTMRMCGSEGLRRVSQMALLNANYLMKKLEPHYKILYKGDTGFCAHEFIIDLRPFQKSIHLEAEDVAKRLMDYSFHAPTLAFPVPGTLMVEPTESEPLYELDRFAEAMISIRGEIREIEEGKADPKNNVLVNSPHSIDVIASDQWDKPYSREKAAFPVPCLRRDKFWPYVGRIDGAYGDRNLMCTCSW